MVVSPLTWWRSDTTRHSFYFASFLVGLPFTLFNTYVFYQIQVVGFLIGHDIDGLPCTGTYCIVPFGNSEIDLNTAILYLNALGYAIGGVLTIFIAAYADFWGKKHLMVTAFVVLYGALSAPAYWLRHVSKHALVTMMGIFVAFFIVTLIIIALLNVYIPHCMREVVMDQEEIKNNGDNVAPTGRQKYGFKMTVFGTINSTAGGVLMLVITIILSATLEFTAAQSSGLLVTTVVGFVTMAGSVVGILGLPTLKSRPLSDLNKSWTRPLVEIFSPFRDIFRRKDLGIMLVAYTIYTDATFAMSSITSQLYIAEVQPKTLEFSLYSLAQSLFQVGCQLFFLVIFQSSRIRLHVWLLAGYTMILIVPIWGMIGLSTADFGFKNRWEFFVQNLLANTSAALVNTSFRVLFSESIPKGREFQWVSMQIVLWSATSWINYVASGPLQNTTHQLRFPLVLCLSFLCVPPLLEITRRHLTIFKLDRRHWEAKEETEAVASSGTSVECELVIPAKSSVRDLEQTL